MGGLEQVVYRGKKFAVPTTDHVAVFPGQLGWEKRELNRIFAHYCLDETSRVVDPYAGAGISTYLWVKAGASCIAVEIDKKFYHCLEKNVKGKKVELYCEDNQKTLQRLIEEGKTFDMIDVDGMGNIHKQVDLSLELIDKGYLWITTAEFMPIKRNWHQKQMAERYGDGVLHLYEWGKGDPSKRRERRLKFKDVVINKFTKEGEQKEKEVSLVHYVMGETALRVLFSVNINAPKSLVEEFRSREQYLGPASL